MSGKKRQILKCGIIGVGRAGLIHLENLLRKPDKFQVISVLRASSAALETLCHYPSVKIHPMEKYHELIAECDAIVICSPSASHEHYITEALQQGKHVFCEKPLVETLESIRTVYDLGKYFSELKSLD